MAEYGPDRLVPVLVNEDGTPASHDQHREPIPYQREVQQKRLRTAERELAVLGKVNPLALEEFDAIQERHRFSPSSWRISARPAPTCWASSRKSTRVEQVFAEAYADVAEAFSRVFARLFPGGEDSCC